MLWNKTSYFVFHCEKSPESITETPNFLCWRWVTVCIPSTTSAEPEAKALSICLLLWHKPSALMFGKRQDQHSCRWFTPFPLTPVCTSHSQANATDSQTKAQTKDLKETHMFQLRVALFYKAIGSFHLLLSSSDWLWRVKKLTVITLQLNS